MIICIFNCLSLHGNICQVGQKVHSIKHYRKTQINFLANPIGVILNSSYPKLNPWIAFLTWLWQPAPAQLLTTKGFILFSSVAQSCPTLPSHESQQNLASSLILLFLLFSTLSTPINLIDSIFKIYPDSPSSYHLYLTLL